MKKATLFFENMANDLGLNLRLPRPSRNIKIVCSITNACLGVTMIGTGIVLDKASFMVIGSVATVGAIILAKDK